MTVRDLIEYLKGIPEDTRCLVPGFDENLRADPLVVSLQLVDKAAPNRILLDYEIDDLKEENPKIEFESVLLFNFTD
jgi:hypothetical protein